MTMDELIEEYLFYKKMHVRITTFETKKHIIETKILPSFTGKLVVDVEPYDIIQWQHHLSESQKLVKKTVKSKNGKEKVVKPKSITLIPISEPLTINWLLFSTMLQPFVAFRRVLVRDWKR